MMGSLSVLTVAQSGARIVDRAGRRIALSLSVQRFSCSLRWLPALNIYTNDVDSENVPSQRVRRLPAANEHSTHPAALVGSTQREAEVD